MAGASGCAATCERFVDRHGGTQATPTEPMMRMPRVRPARPPWATSVRPAGSWSGMSVTAGDTLGSVDVLGIAQEVTAPVGGIVSAVLAEAGQAVEYGQVLVEIDPLADDLGRAEDDAADGPATMPGVAAG